MISVKSYQVEHEKTELCSELLMSDMLIELFKEGIINFATFEKASKKVRCGDEYTISK